MPTEKQHQEYLRANKLTPPITKGMKALFAASSHLGQSSDEFAAMKTNFPMGNLYKEEIKVNNPDIGSGKT